MNGDSITKYIVPSMLTVLIFLISVTLHSVNKIDEKLFIHLTNDDLHPPRSYIVSKAEFEIFRLYHQEGCRAMSKQLERLENILIHGKQ